MIRYTINGYTYHPKVSTFPGGEQYVQMENIQHPYGEGGTITIFALVKDSKQVMNILLLKDAIERVRPKAKFVLQIPYLPYARQDRVCSKGESFSMKVFANLINSANFSRIVIHDCHSEVGVALLNNVNNVEQHVLAAQYWTQEKNRNKFQSFDAIVAPDAGASKKAQRFADKFNKPMIQCLKQRTEEGIKVTCTQDVTGLNLLVIDDIIDGGGTFIPLAKELKDAMSVSLYATHGIFSKGKKLLNQYYDNVVAYHDWTVN